MMFQEESTTAQEGLPAEPPSPDLELSPGPVDELVAWLSETTGWDADWQRALLVAVVAMAVALLVGRLLVAILRKWSKKTKTELDDQFFEAFQGPLFLTILAVGIGVSFEQLRIEKETTERVWSILQSFVVINWLFFSLRFSKSMLDGAARRRGGLIQPQTVPIFRNFLTLILFGLASYFLLISWAVDPTAWLASASIIGVIFGIAAKDSFANIFAGVFLLADRPYKVGDYVNLESGERGMVTAIGLRSTRLLTRDDIEVVVPNSVMAATKVVNETGGRWERRRVRIPIGVAYGSDLDEVRQVLTEITAANELVCDDPEPRVRYRKLGDSAIDLELLFWIKEPEVRGQAIDSVIVETVRRFGKIGIQIPFPQRVVHVTEGPFKESDATGS